MKNRLKYFAIGILASWFICNAGFTVINNHRTLRHIENEKKYLDEQTFRDAIKKEKKALGIEDLFINTSVSKFYNDAFVEKDKSGSYNMKFNPEYMRPLVLRHELYHVKKRSEEKLWQKPLRGITFPFPNPIEEWKATSYALED